MTLSSEIIDELRAEELPAGTLAMAVNNVRLTHQDADMERCFGVTSVARKKFIRLAAWALRVAELLK